MNYFIVDFDYIPSGSVFYYLNDNGYCKKCKKIGFHSFSYKEGNTTYKRFQRFPDSWRCVVSTRTYNLIYGN